MTAIRTNNEHWHWQLLGLRHKVFGDISHDVYLYDSFYTITLPQADKTGLLDAVFVELIIERTAWSNEVNRTVSSKRVEI